MSMSRSKVRGIVFKILLGSVLVLSCQSRKVPYGNAGSEIGDYRLRNGDPFVTLFEHENYRGKLFRQRVVKECTNISRHYQDWTSSILLHERCIVLCEERNCQGMCKYIYPNQKGVKRLVEFGLNDKAKSLKFCYKY